jgi:hypothetical protein
VVAKRKGFDGGNYQLTLTAHDDAVRIYKNGTQVGGDAPCCNTGITYQLGDLGANDSIEIRLTEISGSAFLAINMAKTNQPVYDYVNNSCNSFFLTGVTTNNWYSLLDNNNKLIVQVNPGTNNLGTVTVRIKHFGTGPANIPSDGGVKFMPRIIDLQSSIYGDANFGVPVKVRLFFKNSELDDYKTASVQPALTINNLYVNHYDGPNEDCDRTNNANHGVTLSSVSGTYGSDAFYMETSVNSFSEFAVSGGIAVLPVSLFQFSGSYSNSSVQLQWRVMQEVHLSGYEIQRSVDGTNFVVAGWLSSTGSSGTTDYAFTDRSALDGVYYYRLRLVDVDGSSVYSNVVMINTYSKGLITVSPNPFNYQIYLHNIFPNTTYRIIDMQGKMVQDGGVINSTIFTSKLSKGSYILELRSAHGVQEIKVVK